MKLFGESSPENLEFKQWVEMAEKDPELFERLRQNAIDEVIEKAPSGHRQRLRCLQWRIDQERRRSKSRAWGMCADIAHDVGEPGRSWWITGKSEPDQRILRLTRAAPLSRLESRSGAVSIAGKLTD